jgi:nitroreductase
MTATLRSISISGRYPIMAKARRLDMTAIMDVIHRRRSVRDYGAEPVAKATIRELIDAATWAPSAINEQPWLFTVVDDQELLDRISHDAKAHMLATAADLIPDRLKESLRDPDFHIFYHAPALIVISAQAAGPWSVEDCALAAQNLMLAASAAGLGTCWIGFAQGWLQTGDGKKVLGLPAESVPVAPIIVGHPKSVPTPVPRRAAHINWISANQAAAGH